LGFQSHAALPLNPLAVRLRLSLESRGIALRDHRLCQVMQRTLMNWRRCYVSHASNR
jgi:hypothetical protein